MKTSTKVEESKESKELERLQALIEEMKLALLYLNFDVEATRRERDHWRKIAESK